MGGFETELGGYLRMVELERGFALRCLSARNGQKKGAGRIPVVELA